jgi:hypothetical protein
MCFYQPDKNNRKTREELQIVNTENVNRHIREVKIENKEAAASIVRIRTHHLFAVVLKIMSSNSF